MSETQRVLIKRSSFFPHTHLCIGWVKQSFWDLQPLSPKVTVVAVRQLIVHSGHLCSNPDR